ncbi:J domain-containing protein [Microbacterium esteraromaticum]|uniref:J domain-containing protein n=1 Tax=Microbacterium esteraromaticum TaxID=57043 RepID=UPI001C93EAB0|nr:J domain-containing protein [Microbacterium esteraromaticum]MBY6061751.1 J domain-containing protein [Microbacterium esteraromaticum]
MFDSPLSASAYEVLGVAPEASDDELRRAFRLQLRRTHPDAGGDAAVFIRVQRAWELVGTPQSRAAYDRGHGFAGAEQWSGWGAPPRTDTRPRAQVHGEAGGWLRRQYVARVQEWADADIAAPYDPAFVRTIPVELRALLAHALAEEESARILAGLGMGFTVWHDVAAPHEADAAGKIDHVVLGPSGLFGVMSADTGGDVRFRGGEVLGADAPVGGLVKGIRLLSRTARVRFSAALLVFPDDDLAEPVVPIRTERSMLVAVMRRSVLPTVLRTGIRGTRVIGGNELFDVRTRLQQTVRFA